MQDNQHCSDAKQVTTTAAVRIDLDSFELDEARRKFSKRRQRFGAVLALFMLPGLVAVPAWLSGNKRKRVRSTTVDESMCIEKCRVHEETLVTRRFVQCFDACLPAG